MTKINNFMHRPALMESRDTRKIHIDKAIGDMLAHDRSTAIKVLNFLDKNPTNWYAILANELSNFLTKEECLKRNNTRTSSSKYNYSNFGYYWSAARKRPSKINKD